jgi:hypothetical protein
VGGGGNFQEALNGAEVASARQPGMKIRSWHGVMLTSGLARNSARLPGHPRVEQPSPGLLRSPGLSLVKLDLQMCLFQHGDVKQVDFSPVIVSSPNPMALLSLDLTETKV